MRDDSKKGWMVWAIVILAILNITTLLTILYHQYHSAKIEFVTAPVQDLSENSSIQYSGRYFRDKLNLSKEQMNKFVDFNPEFREKVRGINLSLERIRQKMLAEMAANISDKNKLDILSDSIGYLHSSLKKLTYMYYLDIKSICDHQQQKKLEELFNKMFTSDVMMGHNSYGGLTGRRFGRRTNN
jgi:hypothetical protein